AVHGRDPGRWGGKYSLAQPAPLIYEVISADLLGFPMRPLPTELLRSFVVVAQTGSFTVASEHLCLSQSTVSQHIRRLEDLVGMPLFERDTRNVRKKAWPQVGRDHRRNPDTPP